MPLAPLSSPGPPPRGHGRVGFRCCCSPCEVQLGPFQGSHSASTSLQRTFLFRRKPVSIPGVGTTQRRRQLLNKKPQGAMLCGLHFYKFFDRNQRTRLRNTVSPFPCLVSQWQETQEGVASAQGGDGVPARQEPRPSSSPWQVDSTQRPHTHRVHLSFPLGVGSQMEKGRSTPQVCTIHSPSPQKDP